MFKQAMETFSKRRDQLNQNQTKLYGTVWGQCSPVLQSEVIGDLDYKEKSKDYACLWLLNKLQKLCSGSDDNSNCYVATFSAIRAFYTLRQKENKTLEAYHKHFEACIDMVGMSKGSLFQYAQVTSV